MRIGWTRIGRADNFTEQQHRWISEIVFLDDGIERNVFGVMTELAVRHVENNPMVYLGPVGATRQKNELGLRIDKPFDEPGAGDPSASSFLASDPFHGLSSFMAIWF